MKAKYYAAIFPLEGDPFVVKLKAKSFDEADEEVSNEYTDAPFTWIFDNDSLRDFVTVKD